MGEENLRHLDAEALKRFFIGPHQPALSDCCCRLLHRQTLGILFEGSFLMPETMAPDDTTSTSRPACRSARQLLRQSIDALRYKTGFPEETRLLPIFDDPLGLL